VSFGDFSFFMTIKSNNPVTLRLTQICQSKNLQLYWSRLLDLRLIVLQFTDIDNTPVFPAGGAQSSAALNSTVVQLSQAQKARSRQSVRA
jgi:hypothetical protein